MFGYVNINKQIEDGQRGLWQAFMCGLCLSTKKLFGDLSRVFITNDINFFNVLFHGALNEDVVLQDIRCVSHPVTKRPSVTPTELTDKMSVANVILNYWNIYDDVLDNGRRKTVLKAYGRAYKRARTMWPQLDEAVAENYCELRRMEKENSGNPDMVAHSFACLSRDFCSLALGEKATADLTDLCYNIGKWIYLVDALDDAEKDLKKGNYNVFVSCYGVKSVAELIPHLQEITFLMFAVLNRAAQCFNDSNITKYSCVLKNVIYDSLREKTRQILAKIKQSEKKG